MAWIIRDFECIECGIHEQMVERGVCSVLCCGQTANAVLSPNKIVGAYSFNPHFDITQGQYFKSAEHKRNWLKAKDKEQVDGSLSPRYSGGGRVICSDTQAKIFNGMNSRKIKQRDLPLTTNRRTSVSLHTSSKY